MAVRTGSCPEVRNILTLHVCNDSCKDCGELRLASNPLDLGGSNDPYGNDDDPIAVPEGLLSSAMHTSWSFNGLAICKFSRLSWHPDVIFSDLANTSSKFTQASVAGNTVSLGRDAFVCFAVLFPSPVALV